MSYSIYFCVTAVLQVHDLLLLVVYAKNAQVIMVIGRELVKMLAHSTIQGVE